LLLALPSCIVCFTIAAVRDLFVRMSAAVLTGVGGRFEVADVVLDGPREGEILVRIHASGLCASDLNGIDGKRTLVPFPAVLGHEAAGVVIECGEGVAGLDAGDHVVLSIVPSCGTCAWCLRGRPNFCTTAGNAMARGALFDGTRRLHLGKTPLHHFLMVASFAEYAVVPATGAVRVRKDMPLDCAALISCAVLTGYGAVHNTARVRPASRVVVFGCGGVGLNIVQGARIAGAERIIAVDVTEEKLDLATVVGATDVVNASTTDPVAAVRDLTGGADYAFEAVGSESTIQQAWQSLEAGGEVVLVGLLRSSASLTLDAGPFLNEQSIRGCYFGSSDIRRDVPALVDLYLEGHLHLDELISHRVGLEDLNDSFEELRLGRGARHVVVLD
jgi:S-(hydroxymethyl)glutathione dehydrogenase/alcohol dehydrogenase